MGKAVANSLRAGMKNILPPAAVAACRPTNAYLPFSPPLQKTSLAADNIRSNEEKIRIVFLFACPKTRNGTAKPDQYWVRRLTHLQAVQLGRKDEAANWFR